MKKPHVVCVVGAMRHVGKTTILTKTLKEMKRRGLQVGTIKHIGNRSNFVLPNGKDTSRHLKAGSSITLAVTSSEIIIIRKDLPATLKSALRQMPKELDYVLVEGFRESQYPKIIVAGSPSGDLPEAKGDIIAVVLDGKRILKAGARDQAEKFRDSHLVDLIESYFSRS
nr:molybdopterin-guanine dinucleotide biosynthesis protein B [Candidatus Njordarchaeum guaymaensis]